MKPVPQCLQEMFPCGRPMFATRPWWRQHPDVYMRVDGAEASTHHRMQAIDESRPLPHPGFRVGQVWARMRASQDGVLFVSQIGSYDPDGGSGPRENGAWLLGDEWMPEEELADLLEGAFLMADPACPHLAPWAPGA